MADVRRDVLDRRLRPRGGAVGRRRRSRSSSPSARSSRGRSRSVGAVATQAYANPRYGPDGLALLREGLSAQEVVERLTAADDGREQRQLGVVDAAGRQRDLHRRGVPRLGRRPDRRRATPRRATSSSRRRRSTRSRRRSRAPPASRWPSGCSTCLAAAQAAGGDRRGQQSAALLVVERDGGYAGLSDVARRPARGRPRAPDRGAAAALRPPPGDLRQDAARGVARRSTSALAAELRERLARSATRATSATRCSRWAGTENLEERVDGVEAIDPVVLERAEEAVVSASTRSRTSTSSSDFRSTTRALDVAAGPAAARHPGVRHQRVHRGEAGDRVVEEHDERRPATRSCTSSSTGRATLHGRGRGDRRAGRHVRLRAARRRSAAPSRPRPGRRCWRSAPSRARPTRGLGLGGNLRRVRPPPQRRRGEGTPGDRGRGWPSVPDAWQGHLQRRVLRGLAGNTEAALEHLRRAIELDPQAPRGAQTDSDFDWRSATTGGFPRDGVVRRSRASPSCESEIAPPSSPHWAPVRRHFDISAFGVNA